MQKSKISKFFTKVKKIFVNENIYRAVKVHQDNEYDEFNTESQQSLGQVTIVRYREKSIYIFHMVI